MSVKKTNVSIEQASQTSNQSEQTKLKAEDLVKANGDTVDSNDSNKLSEEVNGPKGPEPTRYGDWESKGRCYDF